MFSLDKDNARCQYRPSNALMWSESNQTSTHKCRYHHPNVSSQSIVISVHTNTTFATPSSSFTYLPKTHFTHSIQPSSGRKRTNINVKVCYGRGIFFYFWALNFIKFVNGEELRTLMLTYFGPFLFMQCLLK